MNKEEIMVSLKKYIVFFYIYAFLGWIIDVSIVFVSDGHLTNRGFWLFFGLSIISIYKIRKTKIR